MSAIGGVDDLAQTEVEVQFDRVAANARETTLEVFATDESASVQVRTIHTSSLLGFACSFVRPSVRARSALPCRNPPPSFALRTALSP